MSSCRHKRQLHTELDTPLTLARVQSWNDDNRPQKVPHHVYRCERCPGWHLTAAPLTVLPAGSAG